MLGLKNIAIGNQEDSDILFVLSLGQSDLSFSTFCSRPDALRAPQSHGLFFKTSLEMAETGFRT